MSQPLIKVSREATLTGSRSEWSALSKFVIHSRVICSPFSLPRECRYQTLVLKETDSPLLFFTMVDIEPSPYRDFVLLYSR
jgi:hypothetical protein